MASEYRQLGTPRFQPQQQLGGWDYRATRDLGSEQFLKGFVSLSQSLTEAGQKLGADEVKKAVAQGEAWRKQSKKTFRQAVADGELHPSQNPHFAVGALATDGEMTAMTMTNQWLSEWQAELLDPESEAARTQGGFESFMQERLVAHEEESPFLSHYQANSFYDVAHRTISGNAVKQNEDALERDFAYKQATYSAGAINHLQSDVLNSVLRTYDPELAGDDEPSLQKFYNSVFENGALTTDFQVKLLEYAIDFAVVKAKYYDPDISVDMVLGLTQGDGGATLGSVRKPEIVEVLANAESKMVTARNVREKAKKDGISSATLAMRGSLNSFASRWTEQFKRYRNAVEDGTLPPADADSYFLFDISAFENELEQTLKNARSIYGAEVVADRPLAEQESAAKELAKIEEDANKQLTEWFDVRALGLEDGRVAAAITGYIGDPAFTLSTDGVARISEHFDIPATEVLKRIGRALEGSEGGWGSENAMKLVREYTTAERFPAFDHYLETSASQLTTLYDGLEDLTVEQVAASTGLVDAFTVYNAVASDHSYILDSAGILGQVFAEARKLGVEGEGGAAAALHAAIRSVGGEATAPIGSKAPASADQVAFWNLTGIDPLELSGTAQYGIMAWFATGKVGGKTFSATKDLVGSERALEIFSEKYTEVSTTDSSWNKVLALSPAVYVLDRVRAAREKDEQLNGHVVLNSGIRDEDWLLSGIQENLHAAINHESDAEAVSFLNSKIPSWSEAEWVDFVFDVVGPTGVQGASVTDTVNVALGSGAKTLKEALAAVGITSEYVEGAEELLYQAADLEYDEAGLGGLNPIGALMQRINKGLFGVDYKITPESLLRRYPEEVRAALEARGFDPEQMYVQEKSISMFISESGDMTWSLVDEDGAEIQYLGGVSPRQSFDKIQAIREARTKQEVNQEARLSAELKMKLQKGGMFSEEQGKEFDALINGLISLAPGVDADTHLAQSALEAYYSGALSTYSWFGGFIRDLGPESALPIPIVWTDPRAAVIEHEAPEMTWLRVNMEAVQAETARRLSGLEVPEFLGDVGEGELDTSVEEPVVEEPVVEEPVVEEDVVEGDVVDNAAQRVRMRGDLTLQGITGDEAERLLDVYYPVTAADEGAADEGAAGASGDTRVYGPPDEETPMAIEISRLADFEAQYEALIKLSTLDLSDAVSTMRDRDLAKKLEDALKSRNPEMHATVLEATLRRQREGVEMPAAEGRGEGGGAVQKIYGIEVGPGAVLDLPAAVITITAGWDAERGAKIIAGITDADPSRGDTIAMKIQNDYPEFYDEMAEMGYWDH